MRVLGLLSMLLVIPGLVFAAPERPPCSGNLDVIKFKDSSFEMVGDVVSEEDSWVTIIPENGGRVKLMREVISEISYDAREPKQVTTKQLVDEFSHCLSRLAGSVGKFRVAKVTPEAVYLNIGALDRVRPGMELNIYREGEDIIDPETGRMLGREKEFVGIVQIVGVEKEYSQAVPVEVNAENFREGDTGEFLRTAPTLAVAGITALNGDESPYGMLLSEQIIGTMKQNPEFRVVERKHLGQILRELAIEKFLLPRTPADATQGDEEPIALKTLDLKEAEPPEMPDSSLAEKLHMIKGADAVIVGTVADVNGAAAVNLRVVDTSTAAILYSTHKVVGNPEKSIQAGGLFDGIAGSDKTAPEETGIETVKSGSRSETDKGDLLDRILRAIYTR